MPLCATFSRNMGTGGEAGREEYRLYLSWQGLLLHPASDSPCDSPLPLPSPCHPILSLFLDCLPTLSLPRAFALYPYNPTLELLPWCLLADVWTRLYSPLSLFLVRFLKLLPDIILPMFFRHSHPKNVGPQCQSIPAMAVARSIRGREARPEAPVSGSSHLTQAERTGWGLGRRRVPAPGSGHGKHCQDCVRRWVQPRALRPGSQRIPGCAWPPRVPGPPESTYHTALSIAGATMSSLAPTRALGHDHFGLVPSLYRFIMCLHI